MTKEEVKRLKPGDIVKCIKPCDNFTEHKTYVVGGPYYNICSIDLGFVCVASNDRGLPGGIWYDNAEICTKFGHGWESAGPIVLTQEEDKKLQKCECGVDSVGAGMHSNWCPKN